jgi:uncharacterized protein (DUF697 family)
MNLSEEMGKMVEVVKNHKNELLNGYDWFKCYFAPDIPDKIGRKLIKYYDNNLAVNSLIAFFDTTILGTAKNGFLFTNDGMYYKDVIGKANYFAYKDIYQFRMENNHLYFEIKNSDISEFTISNFLDMEALKKILINLKAIDEHYGQSSTKTSGKVKEIDLPPEKMKKCSALIHTASVSCGGVGTGLAQIPGSDNAVIVPIQIGMLVGLGKVFDLDITESVAKSIIASAGASVAGRTVSQFLVGWIPGVGNAINTATAAGITESIGWLAVKHFHDRWMEDLNKGRFEGMKSGYEEASGEYERKLREQAEEFFSQRKSYEKERDEYEKLLKEYEEYIKELERRNAALECIMGIQKTYDDLKNLRSHTGE